MLINTGHKIYGEGNFIVMIFVLNDKNSYFLPINVKYLEKSL